VWSTPERRIARATWGRCAARLSKPYELSFASLRHFDAVWVRIEDERGAVGLGESVALPGYAWETADGVADTVAALLDGADRSTAGALEQRCRELSAKHPFAASAVMTALELPALLGAHRPGFGFPINVPVSGETPPETLRAQVEKHLRDGYAYIKVKVGRNLEAECAAARALLAGEFAQRFAVVFDANQAYSLDQARRFADALAALPRERLLWLEQPVDRDDWQAMGEICRHAEVPVVLDEAIYSAEQIERAAAIGAHGVKLKGCKQLGARDALTLARRARALGLDVVFGNGVATDVGNLAEILVLEAGGALFSPPAECSGFAKLIEPLLPGALEIVPGGKVAAPLPAHALAQLIGRYRDAAAADNTLNVRR
jgi:muconate cycloisomerase